MGARTWGLTALGVVGTIAGAVPAHACAGQVAVLRGNAVSSSLQELPTENVTCEVPATCP